jgi:hypothetical protein
VRFIQPRFAISISHVSIDVVCIEGHALDLDCLSDDELRMLRAEFEYFGLDTHEPNPVLYVKNSPSKCYVVNLLTDTWLNAPPPPEATARMCAVGESVYAVGGHSWEQRAALTGMDVFNWKTWESVAPLPTGPRLVGYALCGAGGLLYLTGGYESATPVSATAVYDPKTDSWDSGALLANARAEHAMCSLGDTPYVFGGRAKLRSHELRSVERLDKSTNRWIIVAPMPRACARPTLCVFGEVVYVVRRTVEASEMWQYDPVSDSWRERAPPPPETRGGAGSCQCWTDGEHVQLQIPRGPRYVYNPVFDTWALFDGDRTVRRCCQVWLSVCPIERELRRRDISRRMLSLSSPSTQSTSSSSSSSSRSRSVSPSSAHSVSSPPASSTRATASVPGVPYSRVKFSIAVDEDGVEVPLM